MEVLPDDRSRWSSESPSFVSFRTKPSRHSRPFVLSIRVDSSAPPAPSPVISSPAPVVVTVNGTSGEPYQHQKVPKQDVSVTAVKVVTEVVRVPPSNEISAPAVEITSVPVIQEEQTPSKKEPSDVNMVLPVVCDVTAATVVPVGSVTEVRDFKTSSEVRVQCTDPIAETPKTFRASPARSIASSESSSRRTPERATPPVMVEERTYEERLKSSSDGDDEVDGEMHFHLNVERGEVAGLKGEESAGALLLPGAVGTIRSSRGTVRGVKNRVRAGIAAFLQHENSQGYRDKERGKVILYTTSMGVVRRTFHKCLRVKQILRTLLVPFEERDASTSTAIREEIQRRLGSYNDSSHSSSPPLPQLFVEGQYVGDAEEIERLNETGELRRMLKPFQNPDAAWTCNTCGGYQKLPCSACGGSKRSLLRNAFTEEFVALRCMVCDEAGLVRCSNCT